MPAARPSGAEVVSQPVNFNIDGRTIVQAIVRFNRRTGLSAVVTSR